MCVFNDVVLIAQDVTSAFSCIILLDGWLRMGLFPLGNFADISYLVENLKSSLLRDVCTLCFGALVCKSL